MSAPAASVGQQPGSNNSSDFPRTDSHGRKPSVVISASGATGQIPNGASVGHNARPNIAFGSMGNNPHSPAIAHGNSYQNHGPGLTAPAANPRITSPSHSPAPIPQPPASGGKPPAGLPGQGNGLVFGAAGVEHGEQHFRSSQGPLTPGSQPAHLRRESSQSGHSEMNNAGMNNMNRGFVPPGGRGGRGAYMGNQGSYSPNPAYRNMPNSRGPPVPNQYQNQPGMVNQGYRGRNSPAVNHAQPHMPQGMQHQYAAYPQHLGPQQMYGGPPFQYDPNAGYYQPYYNMQNYSAAPPSPRPGQSYQAPYGAPTHGASPYTGPVSMSRSGSQLSERPASSIGSRPPTNAGPVSQSTTPAPAAPAAAPATFSNSFQLPNRAKSKAIVIKNAQGEEIHFEKKASPAPSTNTAASATPAPTATTPAPVVVSSAPAAPTPPPRAPSASEATPPARVETRSAKTDAEIKTGFQEQVKKQLEAQREAERKSKEEVDATTSKPAEPARAEAKVEAKAEPTPVAAEPTPKDEAEPIKPAAEETPAAAPAESKEDEAARLKREEDERIEAEIAEMEALEREEEERERAYKEKQAKAAAEKKKRDEEVAKNADAEMKRLEREAEELELKRERERENGPTTETEQQKADKDLFASLKKPTLGPGAEAESAEVEAEEPAEAVEEKSEAPADAPRSLKPKPAQLKLHDKPVEPPQPTAGMQALKTARLLDIQSESVKYPDGISSPNPALTSGNKGRQYDRAFLLQFQDVFKEKPTIDWDQRVKDTLGDGEPGSARAGGSRQNSVSMSTRQASARGGQTPASGLGPMGSFGGAARGTTSDERFKAATQAARGVPSMGGFSAGRGGFPVQSSMSRSGSLNPQAGQPTSPRAAPSSRGGKRDSQRGRGGRKEDEVANKTMPLTAGMELKSLEKSTTGWTARSIAGPVAGGNSLPPDGMMPPDMVQRKVKAALNKMTPEKFDKISDQIMEISGQSIKETDGRTLRQVIQLTFEKACDEAHWAGMYAKFCQKMLTQMSNDIVDKQITKNGEPVVGGGLFRKYLLNRCQEEFERGWEANLPPKPEGEEGEAALLSDEYYVAAAAKRRGLGLIQFIGELYKLGMLTYRIMHQCVLRLLDFEGAPDESAVENLCKLLRTIGATMDYADDQSHQLVVFYFERVDKILEQHQNMPSRSRFMLMDVIDLRKHKWQDKAAAKGPKTIQEIRAEAEAAAAAAEIERQRTKTRMPPGRGDARSFSNQGGMPPPDYNRNTLEVGDLRRLQQRNAAQRTASSGLGPSLGPGSSLYAGRSSSGRGRLGPPRDGDASNNTSRTNTPPIKAEEKKEANAQANSFSALAALENEGNDAARSPPSEKASPAVGKASIDAAAAAETS